MYLRPRGENELWTIAKQLIALDEIHGLMDASIYQKSNPHQQAMVDQMAQAANSAQLGSAEVTATSSEQLVRLGWPVESSASSSSSASSASASSVSSVVDSRVFVAAAAHLLTAGEASLLVTDAGLESVASSGATSSALVDVISNEPDNEPSRFTAEEAQLLWDSEYQVRHKTGQKNDHNWGAMESIFAEQSRAPHQALHRTVWPRSRQKLQNYFFNHQSTQQGKRQRIEEDAASGGGGVAGNVNADDVVGSGGRGCGPADAADTAVAADAQHPVASSAAVTSADSLSLMPVRVFRSDVLTKEEEQCIIKKGKELRESKSQVTGAALLKAYCEAFPTHRRDPEKLLERWQRYYANQKNDKSVWFRNLTK